MKRNNNDIISEKLQRLIDAMHDNDINEFLIDDVRYTKTFVKSRLYFLGSSYDSFTAEDMKICNAMWKQIKDKNHEI